MYDFAAGFLFRDSAAFLLQWGIIIGSPGVYALPIGPAGVYALPEIGLMCLRDIPGTMSFGKTK
jgi:hypothetical protein